MVHFSELSSDSLSNRSLLIHSRMYGGQFLICTSASLLARKMTASRSTKLRSTCDEAVEIFGSNVDMRRVVLRLYGHAYGWLGTLC